MDLTIFDKKDPFGKFKNELYLSKNFPEEFNFLISFSKENNLENLPLKQIIWHFRNKIYKIPKCSNPNCNNEVKFDKIGEYRKFCSIKCSSNSTEIKDQVKKTSLSKYGVDNYAKSNESKEKTKETSLKKYGVKSPNQNKEVKDNKKKTILKKYGVKNYFQTDECKQKIKKTLIERYKVENYSKTDEFKEKFRETSLKKYGVDNPSKNERIKQRKKNPA